MGYYLHDNPPARSQYRAKRRAKLSGLIVIHTAENTLDLTGVDDGAERVARFISRRTDAAGSYHRISDRDSTVPMLPITAEAFHDRGSNRHSVGLSLAIRARDWPNLSADHRLAYVSELARAAVDVAAEIREEADVYVPAVRHRRKTTEPGFIAHGDSDPGRRTDPGPDFPWDLFLTLFEGFRSEEAPPVPAPKTHPDAAKNGPLIRLWLDELDAITYAHRGSPLSEAEVGAWTRDLVKRVYVDGERDLSGTARWLHWKLHTEGG